MTEINNITVKQYFQLPDPSQYDVFFDTMNPKNVLCGGKANLSKLTFDEVEVIRRVLNAPTYEDLRDVFLHCFNIKGDLKTSGEQQLLNENVFSFFQANQYLSGYIVKIAEREKNLLTEEPDEKLEMVNAKERLQPVAHLLTKIRLAEQFSTDTDTIGKWKYSKVFTILVANKKSREVNKDYNQIK